MIENNIPKHWQVKKLGEVCDKITKGGTPTTYGFSFVSEGINFIKIESISYGKVNLISIKNFITEEAHNYQKKSILEENDLLFSIAGTIGETCLIKKEYLPANTNQALAILRGYDKHILPQFLTFQLNSSISGYVKSKARGGAMNNISLEDLKNIDLIIPSLTEQQAIVSKIEELLSELDNGKQQLQTAQQQLKVYRQSLLKWAFEGRFDYAQRPPNSVKDGELPEGWKWVKVSNVGQVCTGSTPSKQNKEFYSNDYPFYKPNDLEAGFNVRNATDNLSDIGIKKARFLPINSILVTCIGATIGKTGIIRKGGASNQQINAIIPSELFNPNFLYYQVIAPIFQKAIKDNASATTLPIINKSKFQNLELVTCNLSEQQKIVDELESKLTVCDKIEETISQSLLQAETLRQSILKKAFEGKLI